MFEFSFIDFDDTLFNTYLFKEDMFGCFARCGVSREDYAITYRQAVFGPLVGYFDYSFKKQADILREMGYQVPDSTIDELNSLFNNNYVDPEAIKFLQDMKKISRQMILLTAGLRSFQEKKIASTGLAKYFDKVPVIIDGGKTQKILDVAGQEQKILFINDNLQENAQIKNDLPYILVVAKKHHDKWDEDDYEKSMLPYFDTLNEITDYVAKLV